MARGKKKENALTPEEKLVQALVPDWEQPYKVPENWCWTKIGTIFDLQAGKNISAKDISPDKTVEAEYPCFGGNGIRGYVKNYSHQGDFPIIGRQGALCGNLNWASGKFYATEHAVVVTCSHGIHKRWAFYCLHSMNLNQYATSVAQPGLAVGTINQVPISLPPIAEQQRIVDRIESLFAKLDEAKEKAQSVLDSFETRKAAILHQAFTGELTTKWRTEHGVNADTWEATSVDSLCRSLKYGTAKKSQSEGKVVVIRMGNLQHGEIDWSDLAYSDDEEDIEKYRLIPGDVLFNRTNSPALVGKTSIYRGNYPAIYAGYLIKLDYDRTRIIGDYLNYALNTTTAKEYCNAVKTDGVNQSNINAKKIGAYTFSVPTLAEQTEIVRILDSLFIKEQQAKEAAEAALDKIDLLKKSILARAFRGELSTNNLTEERAVELIKQILSEKIPDDKSPLKKPRTIVEVDFVARSIMEVLSAKGKTTPEILKSESGLDVDDFYDQLKTLIDAGQVFETRANGESYLEAKK